MIDEENKKDLEIIGKVFDESFDKSIKGIDSDLKETLEVGKSIMDSLNKLAKNDEIRFQEFKALIKEYRTERDANMSVEEIGYRNALRGCKKQKFDK